MLEEHLLIINPLGLHARAAAQLVRLAGQFKSELTIRRDDTGVAANAQSILSVLHLAAPMGTPVTLTADGPDEQQAVAAIVGLIRSGFGEL